MAISASMVKELREMTGAGMMDCKNALVECDGDMDKAVEALREKGLAKAAKKANRVAAQGLVRLAFAPDNSKAAIVEVNSETDFVAKNEEFVAFVEKLADLALNCDCACGDMEAFLAQSYDGAVSVQDELNNKIAKIGENMSVRRFCKMADAGCKYVGYIHGGGTIGALVGLKTDADLSAVETVGKDVAMQIASMNPSFLSSNDVDSEYIEHEKKILRQLVINEGGKPELVDKIVEGKLKKELKEVCLLEQKFVKDNDLTVKQYVENAAKEIGQSVEVVDMVRYLVGDGIEKEEEDFAAEVAKQMGQ